MKKYFTVFFILFAFSVAYAQEKFDSTEIISEVPALSEFHEIIFPMWHNAYPDKDIAALKAFVPKIKTSMEAINNSTLPGILHEKNNAWKEQLTQLNKASEAYYVAAESNDDKAILNAAEELHRQYEMTFRVIRPVMKEIDDYHQTLYIIYHKLYPEKKYTEIAALADDLVSKARAITVGPQDRIKRRLGDKIGDFDKSADELYKATQEFKEILSGSEDSKKADAVNHIHSLYKQLVMLFE